MRQAFDVASDNCILNRCYIAQKAQNYSENLAKTLAIVVLVCYTFRR